MLLVFIQHLLMLDKVLINLSEFRRYIVETITDDPVPVENTPAYVCLLHSLE